MEHLKEYLFPIAIILFAIYRSVSESKKKTKQSSAIPKESTGNPTAPRKRSIFEELMEEMMNPEGIPKSKPQPRPQPRVAQEESRRGLSRQQKEQPFRNEVNRGLTRDYQGEQEPEEVVRMRLQRKKKEAAEEREQEHRKRLAAMKPMAERLPVFDLRTAVIQAAILERVQN